MQNSALAQLETMRRPMLLVRAARHGLAGYRRNLSLHRILNDGGVPKPGQAFERLLEREADFNRARQDGEAAYSVTRHVEVLTALIDEARLIERQKAA